MIDTHLGGDSIAIRDGLDDLDPPALRIRTVHRQEVATVELLTGLGELDVQLRGQQLAGAIPVAGFHSFEEGPNEITSGLHRVDGTRDRAASCQSVREPWDW